MKHEDVWRALDTLAAERASASGLAKRSEPSHHLQSLQTSHARRRARWLYRSLAKVFDATSTTLDAFAALVYGARARRRRAISPAARRLIGLARPAARLLRRWRLSRGRQLGRSRHAKSPTPTPTPSKSAAVDGTVFRDGDLVIVSPNAPVRRGDRGVVVRTGGGE